MGAHVIKVGLSRFVIDLMERGIVTHVGMNGAGPIHDFELALIGATTESVARYIQEGQFGLWDETGWINDIVAEGVRDGLGYGEALGRAIQGTGVRDQGSGDRGQETRDRSQLPASSFQHSDISILAAGYRLRVPVTVHIGIGQDIIHEHPNCDGAALGEASYRDFLIFTQTVTQLQGGVMLNFGTAVMGPEVYLKALSMARNVAHQEGRRINQFTTAVFDLIDLGDDLGHEASKARRPLLLPPVQDHPRAHRPGWRRELLRQGRPPGNADDAVSRDIARMGSRASRDT